jgi:hypothetical protein
MLDYDVAAALCAITTFANVTAFKSAKEFLAFGDLYVLFFHNVNALTGAAE